MKTACCSVSTKFAPYDKALGGEGHRRNIVANALRVSKARQRPPHPPRSVCLRQTPLGDLSPSKIGGEVMSSAASRSYWRRVASPDCNPNTSPPILLGERSPSED